MILRNYSFFRWDNGILANLFKEALSDVRMCYQQPSYTWALTLACHLFPIRINLSWGHYYWSFRPHLLQCS